MKICGIIAEYNPFHRGHARHLALSRKILGDETAFVCAMSGNYVQRGDLAMLEKYARAQAAVQSGADLVLELPLTACLSSAEGFAQGGVFLLDALGCVTHLSFGSESADIAAIHRAAAYPEAQAVQDDIAARIQGGASYAAAVQQAIAAIDAQAGALYDTPNNTLGIAYCAALNHLHSPIQPLTVPREGAAHDSTAPLDGLPSASYLRTLIQEGRMEDCWAFMPDTSFAILQEQVRQGAAPVWTDALSLAMLAHLRRLSPANLAAYSGSRDGLEHRLWQAIQTQVSFGTVCAAAQTRRYPLARIRRVLLRAWLDLPQSLGTEPQYIRILAIGARGREVLRRMKKTCSLPVIIKPVSERALPQSLQAALARDTLADNLYALAYSDISRHIAGERYKKVPFMVV